MPLKTSRKEHKTLREKSGAFVIVPTHFPTEPLDHWLFEIEAAEDPIAMFARQISISASDKKY